MAGRHIGAAIAGAIGAGLAAGAFALFGWWIGTKLAFQVRKLHAKALRFSLDFLAVIAWLFAMGLIGILAQSGTGRIRP